MRDVVWLGAHKTGTTYLQKCLDQSIHTLRERSIFYMELEEFRNKYTRPLLNENSDTSPMPNEFSGTSARTRLIFDENVPGYVQHALSRRGFYPDMIPRIATIINYLDTNIDEIVFGVRCYDTFLPSLYCETLKSRPFQTFDHYLTKSFKADVRRHDVRTDGHHDGASRRFARLSWCDLLDRLAASFPDAAIRVYFHEELRGNEARLISNVLDIPEDEITLPTSMERVGFSSRAVEELSNLARERTVERADVRRMVRSYPNGPDYPTFYPWSDHERDILRTNYARDSEKIRADRRLEVIGFPEAAGV